MRAAADIIEVIVFVIFVRRAQEGVLPSMRMPAVDRATRHQVTRAYLFRRPDVARHDVLFDLRETACAQTGEDTSTGFPNLFFVPFIVIVRWSVGHYKHGFAFARSVRTITSAARVDIYGRIVREYAIVEQFRKLALVIAGEIDRMMTQFRHRASDSEQHNEAGH